MKRNKHYIYRCAESSNSVHIYRVDLELDFYLLYDWMHQPHVAEFWQLNKPREELLQHFKHELSREHQELFILSINDQFVAYAEAYAVAYDKLAEYYPHQANDYGLHILIGEPSILNKGYSKLIVRGLCNYLFTQQKVHRIVGEPSTEVKQLEFLEYKLGFQNLGELKLPEKTATLYAIDRDRFYLYSPNKITCDTSNWPVLRLHFPSHPSDTIVEHWLSQLDSVIQRADKCVVISSCDENYQFSQNARKAEMKWYKSNKLLLEQLCLGMLRITNDPEMIKRLNSPAMQKGSPIRCIACSSMHEARQMATDILKQNDIEWHYDEQI